MLKHNLLGCELGRPGLRAFLPPQRPNATAAGFFAFLGFGSSASGTTVSGTWRASSWVFFCLLERLGIPEIYAGTEPRRQPQPEDSEPRVGQVPLKPA